jgi:hypothetical protein
MPFLIQQVYNSVPGPHTGPEAVRLIVTGLGYAGPNGLIARWPMTPLTILLIAWLAFTAVLIILLIYRGTLTMHEDDQLFLDPAESHIQKEQQELLSKVQRLNWPVRITGTASAVLFLLVAGLWVYEGLTRVQ